MGPYHSRLTPEDTELSMISTPSSARLEGRDRSRGYYDFNQRQIIMGPMAKHARIKPGVKVLTSLLDKAVDRSPDSSDTIMQGNEESSRDLDVQAVPAWLHCFRLHSKVGMPTQFPGNHHMDLGNKATWDSALYTEEVKKEMDGDWASILPTHHLVLPRSL